MNRFSYLAPFLLATMACSAQVGKAESGNQAVTSTGDAKDSVDAAGCGDGVTSTPNVWFMEIPSANADQGGLFQEMAIMSSNLFAVSSVSPVNPATASGSLVFPEDTTQTTALTFEVTFTPGVNSIALPTIANDSVTYRDQALTQLQGLGAQIGCNQIGVVQPLSGGSAQGSSGPSQTPDSAGCGDGVSSAPNSWFITVNRSDANSALFDQIALMSSNLFSVNSITAINPATASGSVAYPEDVTQTSSLDFEITFTPGVDSISMPTIAEDSVTNRNVVLTDLKSDGVQIDCNNIGVANPLGANAKRAR